MGSKLSFSILITCVVILLFVVFQLSWEKSKIAFVQSSVLVEKYQGMKELNALIAKKRAQKQVFLDSLTNEYEKVAELAGQDQQEEVQRLQLALYSQRQLFQQEMDKEKEDLTQGVLNQVNAFIAKYAEEHDYDLILGTTFSGNILYGKDAIDITDEIVEQLNNEYKK